jgi:hypothetical protein
MNRCVVLTASAFLLPLFYESKNAEDGNISLSSNCTALQTRRPYAPYLTLFKIVELQSNKSCK